MTPYLNAISLPEVTTLWLNEHENTRTGQSIEVDINGTPVIEYISAPKGFQPMRVALGWITKTALDAMEALRDAATQTEMTLMLPDARRFSVVWDHAGGKPIEAEPVQELNGYNDADYFDCVINLIAIL